MLEEKTVGKTDILMAIQLLEGINGDQTGQREEERKSGATWTKMRARPPARS